MKTLTKTPAIIFVLLCLACNHIINTSENFTRKILPPIPKADIKLDKYLVDAEQGGIIKHKTGTIINIPANAFVDKNGKPINGKVEIAYREMHSLSEIFVSGIPMTYDSSGTEYNFESAGMNEIKAFKDGVPVFINKDKTIDIAMKSESGESRFNLYYYDTLQNKWLNKGKDIPVEVDESKFDEPLKPQLASNDKKCFSINVNYKEFPELQVFENTLFQLTDSNDVKIEKGNRKGVYNISFACYEKKVEYEVTPVYDKNDFDKAIKIFEKKFESYKTILFAEIEKEKKLEIERKRNEEKEMKELSKRNKREEKEQKKQAKEQAANKIKMDNLLKKQANQQVNQQANQQVIQQVNVQVVSTPYYPVYRNFGISQFGIYNSDCPVNLPVGATVSAKFVDPKGQPLRLYNYDVILLQPSDKKMFVYHKCSYANFKFNPDVPNIICTSTIDGKLAYFTAEDFKEVKKLSGEYTFKMRISPKEIKSSDDIEELLALK